MPAFFSQEPCVPFRLQDLKRAHQLYSQGDFNSCLQILNDIIAKPSAEPTTYLLRAATFAKLNNHNASTEDIKTFIKLDPDWVKADPTMTGYLRKEKQRSLGSAQKRFFYLKNKFLLWYRSPLEFEPLSAVCLEDASIENSKSSKTSFKLEVLGTVWIMDALSEAMYSEWMSAMREAIGANPWALVSGSEPDRATREEKKRSTTISVR